MKIDYNKEKLKQILDNLYIVMKINMAIVDVNFNFLYSSGEDAEFCKKIQASKEGAEKCFCSDIAMLKDCARKKCFVSHKCHAGLNDSVIPIIKNSIIVGYVIIGRIRQEEDFEKIYNNIKWIKFCKEEMKKAYKELTSLTNEQLKSLNDLLSHIIFENAITLENENFEIKMSEYISQNLNKKLSVENLCSFMLMSKNSLYKNFHNFFGCTINEYILSERINKAKTLILETEEKMSNIADEVGIPNYTYFCRIFKKHTGFSPSKYREISLKNAIKIF